jgi:hypothetical protein
MVHRKARLTQFGRLPLVQRSIELGWHRPRPPRPWAVSRATTYQLAGPLPRQAQPGWPTAAPDSPLPPRPTRFPGPRVLTTPADATARARTGWPGGCTCFAPRSMGAAPPSHEPAWPYRPDQRRAGLSGSRPSRDWRPSRSGSLVGGASGQGSAQRAGVVELGAAVLDVAEVGLLGDGARASGHGCPSWSQRAQARPRPRPWPGAAHVGVPGAADLVLPMHSSQCRTPVGVEALEVGVGTLQGALAQRCPAPLGTSPRPSRRSRSNL